MSTASLAKSEREALCDLMLEVGADAPTLNEGWRVLDLAAHLVAREHDFWATPGLVWGGVFASVMDLAMARRRRQGLESLVAKIRGGAPLLWRNVPAVVQFNEYFIHHEDVRRANELGPRNDRPDLDKRLARLVKSAAPRYLKGFDGGLTICWGDEILATKGTEPRARLQGSPGELLLYLSGRREAARVDLSGDEAMVEQLTATDLSI